jgi:hypothetical protein
MDRTQELVVADRVTDLVRSMIQSDLDCNIGTAAEFQAASHSYGRVDQGLFP